MNLREQIHEDEGGMRLKLYYVNGVPHIGVGHNLRDKDIPAEAARIIFEQDMADARGDLMRSLSWAAALGDVRFEALVQMVYQMGAGGLLGFRKALAAMQAGDWPLVYTELLDSDWAKQTPERARRIAAQMKTGVRQ